MKLYLDSTNNKRTIIRLDDEEFVSEVNSPRDQNVFGFLLSCLDKKQSTIQEISEIEVNPGPGTFTGTRIGISIGNSLAFANDIKINSKNPPIEPVYSAPPSITTPKKG